jgi:hypothetical protein
MFTMLLSGLIVLLQSPAAPEAVTLQGKVVLLTEALPAGWKVDAAPIAAQVVRGQPGAVRR